MARRSYSSISRLVLTIGIFFTVAATPAWSEDSQVAGESFDRFAQSWMDSVHELGVGAQPTTMIDEDARWEKQQEQVEVVRSLAVEVVEKWAYAESFRTSVSAPDPNADEDGEDLT